MPAAARSFYGQCLHATESSGFRLTATEYAGGFCTPRHNHELAYLSFVLEGAREQRIENGGGGSLKRAEGGELVFHPAGERHSDRFLAPRNRLFQVEIFPERLRQFPEESFGAAAKGAVRSRRCQWLAARMLEELQYPDAITALSVEGLSLELLSVLCREGSMRRRMGSPTWVRRAREIVRDRFAERLTLSEVADEVGVSNTHLARGYRQFHRCTLGEDLRQRRIEYACAQLCSTCLSLAEISVATGFCDQAHFTRTFQRALGTSPGEYRRAHSS